MESPAQTTWKGYTTAERDRRWGVVRKNAAEAGFDCIFVPLGNGQDARYLTQSSGGAMVMPTDGRPPIVINDRGRSTAWVSEVRPAAGGSRGSWVNAIVQALQDAGMERGRIGVPGLKGGMLNHVRSPDGVATYGGLADVMRQLPNATFEDASAVVGYARYVKSDEEIACLRRAAAIAEAGVEEMVAVAKPGVDAAHLYSRVTARMMDLGGEHYHWAIKLGPLDDDEARVRYTEPPLGRPLGTGDYIENEVSAIWGGMVAQEDQPIYLGRIPDEWKPIIELQREVFDAGLEYMRPGVSFGDMIDYINGFSKKPGLKTLILMHGRGLGDDGPLLTPRSRGDAVRNMRIEKGNCWVWKPYAMTDDERLQFVWGGDVTVTDTGGELLFKRPHGMVSIS